MSPPVPLPIPRPKPARAASHLGRGLAPGIVCVVCGGPRDSRKREACGPRCRAALSRRRKAEAQAERDQAIKGLLEAALRRMEH